MKKSLIISLIFALSLTVPVFAKEENNQVKEAEAVQSTETKDANQTVETKSDEVKAEATKEEQKEIQKEEKIEETSNADTASKEANSADKNSANTENADLKTTEEKSANTETKNTENVPETAENASNNVIEPEKVIVPINFRKHVKTNLENKEIDIDAKPPISTKKETTIPVYDAKGLNSQEPQTTVSEEEIKSEAPKEKVKKEKTKKEKVKKSKDKTK